jgi:hypothetical protein
MIRWTLAIVGLLGGCVYGPDDFRKRVTATDEVLIDTPPPPAPSLSGEALHQVLYQDEFGSVAHPAGQRARMLAWLVSMELNPAQLRGLAGLCKSVEAIQQAEAVDMAKTGARELTYFGPIYAELIEILAEGAAPDEQIYADLAQRLEAAHLQVHQEGPPLERQRQRAQGVIEAIIQWMRSLNTKQKEMVSSARFFLRRRLGPLVNPGHYEWVVGSRWDGGDFDILRYTGSVDEAGGMDLAGLWQAEAYRVQPDPHLRLLQARAIMAMAVTEPGLIEAIQVLRGERGALDFSDLSAAKP